MGIKANFSRYDKVSKLSISQRVSQIFSLTVKKPTDSVMTGGGGHSQKNWAGVCGPLPKTFTLFMTKISDIPYRIYDLTKNSKPCLWPDP